MCKPIITYYDLGTFDGRELHTFLHLAGFYGFNYKAVAVDAFPAFADRTRNKFIMNPHVEVINAAISYTPGITRLYTSNEPQAHSIYEGNMHCTSGDFVEVDAIRFSDMVDPDTFNIVRFNIEGAEWDLIRDLIDTDTRKHVDMFLGAQVGWDITKCAEIKDKVDEYFELLKVHDIRIHQWCADTPAANVDLSSMLADRLPDIYAKYGS